MMGKHSASITWKDGNVTHTYSVEGCDTAEDAEAACMVGAASAGYPPSSCDGDGIDWLMAIALVILMGSVAYATFIS